MPKTMTKSQIADHLAGKAGITKKTAAQLLDECRREQKHGTARRVEAIAA